MRNAAYTLERWYGVADKVATVRFPKFRKRVHVVEPKQIPAKGVNNLFVDPCSGRNPFMLWVRETPGRSWVYREWPGNYDIPGHGVPGPWAMPDGKKQDGRKGPAQNSFGFGLKRLKFEMARLEVWKDIELRPREESQGLLDWYGDLDEAAGSAEEVEMRFIDSRYASAKKDNLDMPTTLVDEFAEIGLNFEPAKAEARVFSPGEGAAGGEGITFINDALDYDENEELDSLANMPRLFVSSDCANLIYSLENWTGLDGQKGASKDPIDCLRQWGTAECEWVDEADLMCSGGGALGMGFEDDYEEVW